MLDVLETGVQAILEAPVERSWLVDPANCDMGASTKDVYYAPSWASPEDTTTSCTMSSDQHLHLTPTGLFCVEALGDPVNESCFEDWNVTSSSVTIDGEEVAIMADHQYDLEPFDISIPDGNPFEIDAIDTKAIARSQTVVVKGLDKGEHVVVLAGDFGDGEFAGSLTINLTVE